MDIDAKTAARSLDEATLRHRQVRAAGPNERRIALVWGVFVIVVIPLFDVLPHLLISAIAFVGGTVTAAWTVQYARRSGVLPRSHRTLAWTLWGLWYSALIIGASVLTDSVTFAYSVAAVLGALPLLLFAAGIVGPRSS